MWEHTGSGHILLQQMTLCGGTCCPVSGRSGSNNTYIHLDNIVGITAMGVERSSVEHRETSANIGKHRERRKLWETSGNIVEQRGYGR